MKSHTVPKKLLEQFAYYDLGTRAKWLWRYQKGRPPYPRAAPISATRWPRHFADPTNPAKELEVEMRLKREFEDPVNEFIEKLGDRAFIFTPQHCRLLTGYVRMLFHRSRARLFASYAQNDKFLEAFRAVRSDDAMLSQLSERFSRDLVNRGFPTDQRFTKEETSKLLESTIAKNNNQEAVQRRYVEMMEQMMRFSDENVINGYWGIIRSSPENPFVIGDAPVVTWERAMNGSLMFGQGFARPNVEAFLPVSPTTCLYVLPRVKTTRPVRDPSTDEVNMAQAAFASEYCFANVNSPDIDRKIQRHFGSIKLGVNAFSVEHIDYGNALFEVLMGRGPELAD